ncbi:serum response factor-like isoform X1 [Stegostoma tigrinum]|uniref:serum response factor-like isoform X1 n=1 Tax=Stegostoma tigrinum TaxID=3053191 RepID=UPI00202B0048|nr:serum response factor-like isoform X1 [Stegostoma tigrinum]
MLQSPAGTAPPEPNSSSSSPAGSLQPAAPAPGPGPQAAAAAVLVSRDREAPLPGPPYSCSEPSSDEDEELVVASAPAPLDRRGVKRRLSDLEAAAAAGLAGVSGHGPGLEPGPGSLAPAGGYGAASAPGGTAPGAGLKPGKKTRGRVKIKMEFIDNKLRRYTTFSKRKTGIMKKAYELSTLTGTQVLLLVASETGHVYTFATRKLQPMITSETGKALIQTCLNSPDSPPRSDPTTDQRMSATGFEETDLTYQVSETDSSGENKDNLKPTTFTVANVPGSTGVNQSVSNTSTNLQVSTGHNFPITNYLAPVTAIANSNGTVFKSTGTGTSGSMVQLPSGFTLMSGTALQGTPTIPIGQLQQHSLAIQGQQGQVVTSQSQQGQQTIFRFPASAGGQIVSIAGGAMAQQVPVQTIQLHQASGQVSVHQSTQHTPATSDSSSEISQASTSGAMTLPATIVTSSVPTSMASHVMYPSPHGTVMYTTSSPGLSDGGLTVLNAFSQPSSGMQVSHGQMQEQGGVPQVVLTAPTGTVQIPLSAVQLHQMAVIGQQSCTGSLTELQVSSLETSHSNKLAQND